MYIKKIVLNIFIFSSFLLLSPIENTFSMEEEPRLIKKSKKERHKEKTLEKERLQKSELDTERLVIEELHEWMGAEKDFFSDRCTYVEETLNKFCSEAESDPRKAIINLLVNNEFKNIEIDLENSTNEENLNHSRKMISFLNSILESSRAYFTFAEAILNYSPTSQPLTETSLEQSGYNSLGFHLTNVEGFNKSPAAIYFRILLGIQYSYLSNRYENLKKRSEWLLKGDKEKLEKYTHWFPPTGANYLENEAHELNKEFSRIAANHFQIRTYFLRKLYPFAKKELNKQEKAYISLHKGLRDILEGTTKILFHPDDALKTHPTPMDMTTLRNCEYVAPLLQTTAIGKKKSENPTKSQKPKEKEPALIFFLERPSCLLIPEESSKEQLYVGVNKIIQQMKETWRGENWPPKTGLKNSECVEIIWGNDNERTVKADWVNITLDNIKVAKKQLEGPLFQKISNQKQLVNTLKQHEENLKKEAKEINNLSKQNKIEKGCIEEERKGLEEDKRPKEEDGKKKILERKQIQQEWKAILLENNQAIEGKKSSPQDQEEPQNNKNNIKSPLKQMKEETKAVVSKIFAGSRIKWDEFVKAWSDLREIIDGVTKAAPTTKKGGSMRKFHGGAIIQDGKKKKAKSFVLHEPHNVDNNMIGEKQVKRIQKHFNEKFGWTLDKLKEHGFP